MRTNAVFRSDAFNCTEPREYFINDCCFGDDLARWMIQELRARGFEAADEPGQEDFGWYFTFTAAGAPHDVILGFRPDSDGEAGDWMLTVERRAGFLSSLFGGRKKGIQPEALDAIHRILAESEEITNPRWYSDRESATETGGAPTPV